MLGKITFQQGAETIEATLDEESFWHCHDPNLECFLNHSFRSAVACGVDEEFGILALHHAAGALRGEVFYG